MKFFDETFSKKVLMRIIIFLMFVLLLTSCRPRLDKHLVDIVGDACECNPDKCECRDLYTGDIFILDCTGVEVTGLASIAKECKATCLISGDDWCRRP